MNARVALAVALCAVTAGCGDSAETSPGEPAPLGGNVLWGRRFGKNTTPDSVAMATDGAGNAVVGGRFFATADFGAGPVTSPANNWQAFVAKYDTGGALLWMHSLGDIFEEFVTHVAFDGDGNVYIGGDFRGSIDFGGGPLESDSSGSSVFLAKLAPDGSHLWSKRVGSVGYEALDGMAINAGGDIALSGYAGGDIDLGSGPITLNGEHFIARLDPAGTATYVTPMQTLGLPIDFAPTAIEIDSAGAFVAATEYYTQSGDERLLLFKLDPAGQLAWQRDLAAGGDGMSTSALSLGADSTIFLAGNLGEFADFDGITTSGRYGDAFAAAAAPDGTPRWVRRFSKQDVQIHPNQFFNSFVSTNDIAADGSGVVVTGSFSGVVDFGGGPRQSTAFDYDRDAFIVRLDPSGALVWVRALGSAGPQAGTSVSVVPSGEVFVAGSAGGPLPFGNGAFAGTSYTDGFLVKLSP